MVHALAKTLLAPKARAQYLDVDNVAGDWASITDAVSSGRPWFGRVGHDVLAYDLDTPEAVAAADDLTNELLATDVPVLVARSGSDGHRHLWAVVPDPAEREHWRNRGERLGMPPHRQSMRPPLTAHRRGLPVEVIFPGNDDDVLHDFLADVGAARIRSTGEREPIRWKELLRSGRWPQGFNGDRSGSALTWMVCIQAAREGVTVDQILVLLEDPTQLGGKAYRQRCARRGRSHGEAWIRDHVWPSAIERAQRPAFTGAGDARNELERLAVAIEAAEWAGQAGATDRAVLTALLERGQLWGTVVPNMSHREVAEAAPCHRNTVAASTRRLKAAGWLQVVRRGAGRTVRGQGASEHQETAEGTVWRLLVPRHVVQAIVASEASGAAPGALGVARPCATGGTPQPRTGAGVTSSRAHLDACRWGGLGLNAPRILDQLLLLGPATARSLAEGLGLNLGNLRYRLLPKLAHHGLIAQDGRGAWAVAEDLEERLVAAAEALGLDGKTDEVAARHTRERAEYLDHRAEQRPVRDERSRARIAAWSRRKRPAPSEELPEVNWDELTTTAPPSPARARAPWAATQNAGAHRSNSTPPPYAAPLTATAPSAVPR